MVDLERRIETAKKQAIRQRNYRRVRDRALARLSNLYPDQYRELLEEERVRDEVESKVWIDLSGRTNAGLGAPTGAGDSDKITDRSSNQGEARNVGAEA